jgi:hypothetical protein
MPAGETAASGFDAAYELARFVRLRVLFDDVVGRTGPHSLTTEKEHSTLRALERLETRLISDGRWAAGPATLFGALRLVNHELANCRVLAWLLDPLAPHGLGTVILRSLLSHLNASAEGTVMPPPLGVERAVIATEEWRDRSRADVVVEAPGWTVVIEAKLGASEQREQGQRLADDWPDAVYVFLTRRGEPMRSTGESTWLPMKWSEMLRLVREALASAGKPTTAEMVTARAAVRDYLIATGARGHWRAES